MAPLPGATERETKQAPCALLSGECSAGVSSTNGPCNNPNGAVFTDTCRHWGESDQPDKTPFKSKYHDPDRRADPYLCPRSLAPPCSHLSRQRTGNRTSGLHSNPHASEPACKRKGGPRRSRFAACTAAQQGPARAGSLLGPAPASQLPCRAIKQSRSLSNHAGPPPSQRSCPQDHHVQGGDLSMRAMLTTH